jgi:hypothetical protein
MQSPFVRSVHLLALGLFGLGCGADHSGSGPLPWSEQRTQIVDSDGRVTEVTPASGDGCLDYEGECLKLQQQCGDAAVDVLLDREGKILDRFCYPEDATLSVDELEARQGDVAQNENKSVIVLDDVNDGADISGDVSVDANKVVIYGSSPDTAVIGGSLTLDGNNVWVRGVRIEGDVTVLANEAVLGFCVIEGDLLIRGNGTQLLGCDVLGSITVEGNNSRLSGNRIAGALSAAGKNAVCRDNFRVVDTNGDRVVAPSEVGAALACD